MSVNEYKIILDCALMNLNEEARLPPSFRGDKSGSRDTIRLLADKVNMNSQILLSRTVTILAVVVDHALLELYTSSHEESPLAHIAVSIYTFFLMPLSFQYADIYRSSHGWYTLMALFSYLAA